MVYCRNLKPSADRLDNAKGYSLSNLRLVTWAENDAQAKADMRAGILVGAKAHKAVNQCTRGGDFIAHHVSCMAAERTTGVNNRHIGECANGNTKYSHAGGFLWRYA